MRAAYDKWENAVLDGVETTPAYDVVGLLAALTNRHETNPRESETYFDITRGDFSQEGCDVYRLKKVYRSKETLSAFFLNVFKLQRFKLLVITDFGEECDDEVACLLANSLVLNGVDVRFLFTTATERFAEQKSRFEAWDGNPELVSSIHDKNDVIEWFNTKQGGDSARPMILQIGPIHEPHSPGGWRHTWRPNITCDYDYVVVGTFNRPAALNVKANAKDAALHLKNKATDAIVVDTMGGMGAFKFSAPELVKLELPMGIIYHVCKIGWRNSVGRANPAGGNYVVHLVSEPVGDFQGGANYMTALGIDKSQGKDVVRRARSGRAISIATKYLQQLSKVRDPDIPTNMSIDETTGALTCIKDGRMHTLPVTRDSVIHGYAFILDCLNVYFGVPIEFFESGRPEAWKKQWETPTLRDKAVVEGFKVVPSMQVD